MQILHISDFHYKESKAVASDQRQMIDKLASEIQGRKIDIILLTGDLVSRGDMDFHGAYDALIGKLTDALKIEPHRIFYCCGNHEIDRTKILPAILNHALSHQSNADLDEFMKDSQQFPLSCNGIKAYNDFIRNTLKIKLSSELYWHNIFEVESKRIGMVVINSAWLSHHSTKDKGKLLFPISELKKAVEDVKDADFKILLMHHPLSDFAEYNRRDIENIVIHEFHALFSGHVHLSRQASYASSGDGLFHSIAPAALSFEPEAAQGFMIYDWDLETHEIRCEKYVYNTHDRFFAKPSQFVMNLPVNEQKRELNDLRKTIRRIFTSELLKADDLFVSKSDSANSIDFMKLFTDPTLSKKSPEEIASQSKNSMSLIKYEKILIEPNNILFLGGDKFGKTSLLMKLQLDCLNNFSEFKRLPFYVDLKSHEKRQNGNLNILNTFAGKFGMTRKKLIEFAKENSVLLLIDNYESSRKHIVDAIQDELREVENLRVIVCARVDTYYPKSVQFNFNSLSFEKIYLHSISRRQIRVLANKWPGLSEEKVQVAIDKIDAIFSQLNIHFNYWTVSLFLWIFEKTNDMNFQNNVELMDLYVDNLLGKSNLTLRNNDFSFLSYKSLLAELAHHLYMHYSESAYSISYDKLIEFIGNQVKRNPRIIVQSRDIFEYLELRGVITIRGDDSYSFRLNGIFEYFLAYYMKANAEFRKMILDSDELFLSFSNEIEILSGITRTDVALLDTLYERTSVMHEALKRTFKLSEDKSYLSELLRQDLDSVSLISPPPADVQPLAPEDQDDAIEGFGPSIHSEVTRKKILKKGEFNTDIFGRHIFILGRAFRNSDDITDVDRINKYLDIVINGACDFIYCVTEELQSIQEEKFKHIRNILGAFSSVIAQVFLYDAVGHKNLKNLLEKRIDQLKGVGMTPEASADKIQSNQFQLFVTYFLLIETDIAEYFDKIDEVMQIAKTKRMQNAILAKLYFYLVFKSHKLPALQERLRRHIQQLHLEIDPNADKGKIQQHLARLHEISRLKASNDHIGTKIKQIS